MMVENELPDAELIAAGILTTKGAEFAQRLLDMEMRPDETEARVLAQGEGFDSASIELILDHVDLYAGGASLAQKSRKFDSFDDIPVDDIVRVDIYHSLGFDWGSIAFLYVWVKGEPPAQPGAHDYSHSFVPDEPLDTIVNLIRTHGWDGEIRLTQYTRHGDVMIPPVRSLIPAVEKEAAWPW